jgi:hypothetical protein
MHTKFGLRREDILRIRALMDLNKSYLCINGRKSRGIHNLRGFLQGSAISPKLFNSVMDELSCDLNDAGRGINLLGELINHLMFADDSSLITDSLVKGQILLDICSAWAVKAGQIFAPEKCSFIVKNIPTVDDRGVEKKLLLNNVAIKEVTKVGYLGVEMTGEGIDFDSNFKKRHDKATRCASFFRSKGCNAYGWRPLRQRLIHTCYIRPMLEPGLELKVLSKKERGQLEKEEARILRTLTSFNKSTSGDALNFVYGIDTLHSRNIYLNASYIYEVLHGSRSNHPVGRLAHRLLANRRRLKKGSLMKTFLKQNPFSESVIDGERIKKSRIRELDHQLLLEMHRKSKSRVANRVNPRCLGFPDPIIQNAIHLERNQVYVILQLKLGKLGSYAACKACGQKVSQNHLMRCGVDSAAVDRLASGLLQEDVMTTGNNQMKLLAILANLEAEEGFNTEQYTQLAEIIMSAKEKCMDWVRDFRRRNRDGIEDGSDDIQEMIDDDIDSNHRVNIQHAELIASQSLRIKRRRFSVTPDSEEE